MTSREKLATNIYNVNNAIKLFVEQNNRLIDPLDTNFEYLKWLDEGRLVIIGGASGIGKTAYVLQLLYELTKDNQDRDDSIIGIYASAEMTIEELTLRLLTNQKIFLNDKKEPLHIAQVRSLFNSKYNHCDELQHNINKAEFVLGDIPFYFLNASRFNLENIIDMIRLTREKNPMKRIFVVIDYLQLLMLENDSLQETNRVIKELKDCLVECRANAIAISALNRNATSNNQVNLSAFKDSSMIEYTADIALLLCFEEEREDGKKVKKLSIDEEKRYNDEIDCIAYCVKNRIGKLFEDELTFYRNIQRFEKRAIRVIYKQEPAHMQKQQEQEQKQEKKSLWELI